jgi:polysaccharide pyruvyl transferase WcaK-like protein
MKVSIINHASSLNLGDQSLIVSTINLLKGTFDQNNLDITVFCSDPDDEIKVRDLNNVSIDNVTFKKSPIYRPENKTELIKMGFDNLFNLAYPLMKKNTEFIQDLKSSDLVIVRGGDNFTDVYGMSALISQVLPVIYASRLSKLLFMSHTIGPFKNKNIENVCFSLMKNIDGEFLVRDKYSYKLMKKHSMDNITFIPDVAFTLDVDKDDPDWNRIGIVISGLVYKKAGMAEDEYCKQWKNVIETLCDSFPEAEITLIPHVFREVDSDEKVTRKAWDMLDDEHKERASIFKNVDVIETKKMIGKCHCLISPRMHPIVHALSMGVPVIGVDYNEKTRSLLKYCNLSDYTIDLSKFSNSGVSDDIAELVERLYDRAEYENVKLSITNSIDSGKITKEYQNAMLDFD